MAAPQSPVPFPRQRETVEFEPNVPQTVTLAYAAGKIVSGRHGERVMWGLAGNQVMFLDLAVAQSINNLSPQAGESVCLCRRTKGKETTWDVWLSPDTEKMRSARGGNPELADQLRRSIGQANEARYSGSLHGTISVPASAPESPSMPPAAAGRPLTPGNRTEGLIAEANALVDAFATVLARALDVHQGRIKPEEVRSLLLSAYIQRGKAAAHVG